MKNDGGKGSVQRPTHHELFSKNFEAIFGKKKTTIEEIDDGVYIIEVKNAKDDKPTR